LTSNIALTWPNSSCLIDLSSGSFSPICRFLQLLGATTADIGHELAQLDSTGHRPLRESTAAGLAT